jgi:hypothetical protein
MGQPAAPICSVPLVAWLPPTAGVPIVILAASTRTLASGKASAPPEMVIVPSGLLPARV